MQPSVSLKHFFLVTKSLLFILAFVASLEEFYHVFENSEMKWKRVCMPCYNASVPRRGQSKKIVFLQNADKEINSTMRKILSTDSNVSYFHSAYKGVVGFTALATFLPTPPPPPPQKKKNRKKRL